MLRPFTCLVGETGRRVLGKGLCNSSRGVMSEILVYTDNGVGASPNCVAMALTSLKDTVSRAGLQYTVRTTTSKDLVGSKWRETCQLLVMPGGRDLPYCSELNGPGNRQISDFVQEGGSYLGICAGAYYGSAYVEFAKGDPNMEVLGPRELAFFPVTAKGPTFPGYSYESNAGAHSAGVAVTPEGASILGLPTATEGVEFSLFYNGGCNFTSRAASGDCNNVAAATATATYDVLLTYTGHSVPRLPDSAPSVASDAGVIGGSVGRGRVVLTGLHFEASDPLLEAHYHDDEYITPLLPSLKHSEPQRQKIFDACVQYLLSTQQK